MKIVVGLGNPGKRYQNTRHNIGFRVVDRVVSTSEAINVSKRAFEGELYRGSNLLLLKPLTFMNLSGRSVKMVMQFYKVSLENLIVIHDDIDIPLGSVRFKVGGSSGGHNGLKSIDEVVGDGYLRVRVGVGRPARKSDVVGYVLNPFTPEEEMVVSSVVEYIDRIFDKILNLPINELKSRYTIKSGDVNK